MDKIIYFLKNDIFGILIIGIIGSIIGTLLFILFSKLVNKALKYFKGKKAEVIKNTVRQYFYAGFHAEHAKQSSYHQIVLIGDYVIKIILNCFYIITITIIAVGLFGTISIIYYWIISFLLGVAISFPIIRLKRTIKMYSFLFDLHFKEKVKK